MVGGTNITNVNYEMLNLPAKIWSAACWLYCFIERSCSRPSLESSLAIIEKGINHGKVR